MLFQLPPLSDSFKEKYRDTLLPDLRDRIINSTGSNKLSKIAKNLLIPNFGSPNEDLSNLELLLTGRPKESKDLSDRLFTAMTKGIKNKNSLRKKLERVFDYANVISKNKKNSYWIALNIQRNTCTYCNRLYVHSVERLHKAHGTKERYVTRPEFDHWFTKSKHPLLSLNIHNLIPSCKICNSAVKTTADGDFKKHIHPYIKENFDFTFRAYLTPIDFKWGLKIIRPAGSKIDNTIRDFATEELYASHGELEVKDIMEFAQAYPEGYLRDILVNKDGKRQPHISQEQAYRMLFGTEYERDRFLDRPLSKLKHDILTQIKVISPSSSALIIP